MNNWAAVYKYTSNCLTKNTTELHTLKVDCYITIVSQNCKNNRKLTLANCCTGCAIKGTFTQDLWNKKG